VVEISNFDLAVGLDDAFKAFPLGNYDRFARRGKFAKGKHCGGFVQSCEATPPQFA